MKLSAIGIKVYRAMEGNVECNVDMFIDNALPEITTEGACSGHGHSGGCFGR